MSGVLGTHKELHFNLHGMSSVIGVLGSALSFWLYIMGIPYYKAEMKRSCSDKGWKKKNNKIKLALDPIGLNHLEHLMKFTQRSLVVPLSPLLLVTTTNKTH